MLITLEKPIYFSSPVTKINFEIVSYDNVSKEYVLRNAITREEFTFNEPLVTSRVSFSAFDPFMDDTVEEDEECVRYLISMEVDHFSYLSNKYIKKKQDSI